MILYTELRFAGVVELADAPDSKSGGLITRIGSTPITGTKTGVYEHPDRETEFSVSFSLRRFLPRRRCVQKIMEASVSG